MNTRALRKYLKSNNSDCCATDALISEVISGITHLEKHRIPWTGAALSFEHIQGDSLARTLIGGYEFDRMSGQTIRDYLEIKGNQHEGDLGLDWQEEDEEILNKIRFLWIRAAVFSHLRKSRPHA